jgi:lipoprotein-anchoring transpeptidase ErfK/SrfK
MVSVLLLLTGGTPAVAQSFLLYDDPPRPSGSIYERVMRMPPEDFPDVTEPDEPDDYAVDRPTTEVPPQFRRQVVSYPSREAPGTIVIDTPHAYLYYVLGGGQAIRYGIGVRREGSPGRACAQSNARPNGRIGYRRSK